jgi:hypothetical protein
MGRPHDAQTLKAFVENGRTIREIAEDMGLGYEQVRLALQRRGIRAVWENERSLRQIVQDMKPAEAVEFLLACIENLAPALTRTASHAVEAVVPDLPPQQRRLLIALHDAKGLLSRDQLMAAFYFDAQTADVSGAKIVDVQLSRLRARLVGTRYSIKTHWGRGWTLEIADET